MLTIDQATPEDTLTLASGICAEDAAELRAAGLTVAECLDGTQAQALRWHGALVCLFGAVQHPAVPAGGIPWMLCTDTLAAVPRKAMAEISAHVVAGWQADFDHLSNMIHRRNARAIRFVRWLGFTVGTLACGPGQEFYVFEWSRNV